MSEYDANRSDATSNDTMDDASGGADNSIIGKVKSRVSNIFPNSLYKWFSPSTKANDSINGSLNSGGTGVSNARRRRRLEVEEEEEDDEDEEEDADEEEEEDAADDEQHPGGYDENSLRHNRHNNTDEESNNSEEFTSITGASALASITSRRTLSSSTVIREPPSKRSRFTLDITNTRSSPLMSRQPILSSTPTVGNNVRSSISHPASLETGRAPNRYTHLNLYGHESKKEPAYSFNTAAASTNESVPSFETTVGGTHSSRRSLNIPPSSYISRENYISLANMKRPILKTAPYDMPSTSAGIIHEKGALPRQTSTTVLEDEPDENEKDCRVGNVRGGARELTHVQPEPTKYNGRSSFTINSKRQRLINGVGINDDGDATIGTVGVGDSSASDSSEGVADGNAEGMADMPGCATMQRKTGLFNMSSANSHHGSRTSSFGNGLNFYSHLEGRKSLFSGAQSAAGASAMNNSTLSLTSLNRRQFNASIYGSTSALSDSRLLNTFSPFYKGRTTYGGAAAYNKYAATGIGAGTGVGASAVRIAPTLIRPTSSLSTLSSSTNSLVAAGNSAAIGGAASEHSALSSTAKRILDLINDFATPLSEAKKMASNLKTNQQQQLLLPQAKSRLNDTYLEQSRAMRLSQVRTPYMRSAVTLHPNAIHVNGQANLQLPPVRELQVPSMSQLLQMKKLQNTTERSRQIARQNSTSTIQTGPTSDYSLPIAAAEDAKIGGDANHRQRQQQQKHTNKIKHKITSSARTTSSAKVMDDDAPPPPVNLPNIAFPLMQSVPKIDITLPTSTSKSAASLTPSAGAGTMKAGQTNFKFDTAAAVKTSTPAVSSSAAFEFNTVAKNVLNPYSTSTESSPKSKFIAYTSPTIPTITTDVKGRQVSTNFKFSAPLELKGLNTPTQNITPISGHYKFSPPMLVPNAGVSVTPTQKSLAATPQLKTGSVLDALKKPFTVATKTEPVSAVPTVVSSFGNQFKMSATEWECDACMLRNKQESSKCVACEIPRKAAPPSSRSTLTFDTASAPTATELPLCSSFGSQFKKSAGEWECDACMLRNKSEITKCAACETPCKGAVNSSPSSSLTGSSFLPPPVPIKSSFGDAFKPKANTWECSTCLIQNQNSANECVACLSKKPGASAIAPASVPPKVSFQFGFAPVQNTDVEFKALAAEQKASKWECEACMTRNDAARLKCVCCDQAKPGAQIVAENVPKFSFGSTAAAKFSFGFGAAAQAGTTSSSTLSATTAKTATTQKTEMPSKGGFVFGSGFVAKPTASAVVAAITTSTATASKDLADSKGGTAGATAAGGFTFGASESCSGVAPKENFVFGSSNATKKAIDSSSSSTSITSTASSSSSPSVKFSLPNTTAATAQPIEAAGSDAKKATTFVFGSPATSTTTTSSSPKLAGGFSFGTPPSKQDDIAAKSTGPDSTVLGGFAFKSPAAKSTGTGAVGITKSFSFGSPTAPASTTPAAAVKPMFSFGTAAASPCSSTTTIVASSTTSTTSTSTAAATSSGGFSFGNSAALAMTTGKSIFSVPTAITVAHAPNSTATTITSTSSNVFGSFGNSASASDTSAFSAAPKVSSLENAAPGTTTSAPTFGSFGTVAPAVSSTNVFGAFSGQSGTAKPTASTTPLFGSKTISGTTAAATGSFVFGSGAAVTSSSVPTSTAAPASTAATTWPQSSFAFGVVPIAPATGTTDANKPIFGGFGAVQSNNSNTNTINSGATPTASIFSNMTANASAPNAFGSSATSSGMSAPIFGSNCALRPSNAVSIFGSASAAGNTSMAPSPAFGAPSAFGSSSAVTGATPTFGSTAATAGFGGFGVSAANAAATDGASAAKKCEPAFNFGSTSTQNKSSGFNFGATAAATKPAFNFGTTSQPAFNFTGAQEAQVTKPFQFGAAPLPQVFNFSGGAAVAEATPNAPFQFNAGAAPASSNIFAPNPTPGAQSAQQARRKIRAPIRRLTPR